MTDETVPPLRLSFSTRARRDLYEASEWLQKQSPEQGNRFSEVMEAALPALCQTVANQFASGNSLPHLDEEGSIGFALPTYQHLITTTKSGKRARRSSASTWRIYYTLQDTNADNTPDVLYILAITHAAARPLTAWLTTEADEKD